MPKDRNGFSGSAGGKLRTWIRAEIVSSGELVVTEHTADIAERLGRTDEELTGTGLAELLSGVTPSVVIRRVSEIAHNGGDAFYPQCRFSTASAERWFSLECRFVPPAGVFLSFDRAARSVPCAGEADLALDRFPWGVQAFNRAGQTIGINAAFEQASGLSREDFSDYNILYDPAYRREDLAGLIDRIFEGEMIRFDTRAGSAAQHPLRLFENARRPLYPARGFPLIDGQGEVCGIVMAYEDVSAPKSPTDDPADERQFATEIVETADVLILCLDTSGRITLFNPKCEETSGRKKEEVLGLVLWETLIPSRYVEKVRLDVETTLTQPGRGRTRSQFPWLKKDGRERMISWHNTFHHGPDGKVERIISVGIDISDQIRIERQLRESEERYRSVTESSLTGIFIYQDDRIIYCNARIEEILGLHRDMIIGRPVWKFAHPEDKEMIQDRAKRRQRGDLDLPSHYEFRVINSSGDTRWLEMIVTTMDYQGRRAFLGNVVDITEMKEAESERDELRRRLAQSQKMEALATLIGGITHDFNNLLTGIMAGTSDVLAQTEPDDPRFKPLGDILQTSRRAKDLISRLLTAGSRGPSTMAQLDINEVIWEAMRFVRPTLREDIELRLSLTEEPALVMGDHSQLWQTVSNLSFNARDAMPAGGVLEIKTEVKATGERETEKVVISVSDTGKGIPPEIKDRIFEPFFTTKERGLGIGLGLAVVYGAVKNHGGTIDVLDRPGGGTIFRIQLEKAAVSEKAKSPVTRHKGDGELRHKILIVDDEDGVRQVVGRILSREGHIVQTVKDSEETMDRIADCGADLDLVILDLEMPGKSGAEVFAEIKSARPDLKILLSSGQTPGPVARQLLGQGAAGFLQKPYDLWELRRAVKDAIASGA